MLLSAHNTSLACAMRVHTTGRMAATTALLFALVVPGSAMTPAARCALREPGSLADRGIAATRWAAHAKAAQTTLAPLQRLLNEIGETPSLRAGRTGSGARRVYLAGKHRPTFLGVQDAAIGASTEVPNRWWYAADARTLALFRPLAALVCVEIKIYGALVLNRRVVLHAIDAALARWRGDAGSSPLDGASTAASHPTHWLIYAQVPAPVFIQVGEARRLCGLAHVGGEGAPDAFGATVLLALLQETPRPRLPGLGGPRHATIEEGGCYRTFDAAGHRDSPEVAPPGPREGPKGLARFCARVHSIGT